MKCNHNNHPVIMSYGFLNGDGGVSDEEGRALFIDSGKISGMIHCSNCGTLRMFMNDKETEIRKYGEKSFLKKATA